MEWWQNTLLDDDYEQFSNKRLIIIIYDIVNDKRRRKMVKCLESYGTRVQKSAFECFVDDTMYKNLLKKLEKIIDEKEDLLRVYRLTSSCNVKCWGSIDLIQNSNYWIL
jgi:CRISPR-associated protein Cas2